MSSVSDLATAAPTMLRAQDAEKRHAHKVARVVKQLRSHTSSRPLSLRKHSVSHRVPKPKDKRFTDDKIDVSDLSEIIEIDPHALVCTAEPGVTFEDLVAATLPYGLAPIIVPELKTITIGGAVAGCSIESMSFRHGGFHDTCLEYEVITARGDVLTCTPFNEHRLVFEMIHGSFGTLGILSKLKFRLTPAKRYVHLLYERYSTLDAYKAAIWGHFRRRDVDFVDGFVHSPTHYVLNVGNFVDEAPYTNRYDWMKVYYTSTAERSEDYLRSFDYFFRYDRGVTNVHPKSAIGRLLLGKFLSSAQVLRLAEKLHRFLPAESPDVTVDLFVPFSKLTAFMDWYESRIAHYPLWCVPYRRVRDYEWLHPDFYRQIDDSLFIDLAIYGLKQHAGRNYYREIEEVLPQVNGIKTLISYNYYDPETFWSIWNEPSYLAAKRITDPDNLFRDLYSKTCRAPLGLPDLSSRSGCSG
jgi:FAD/FMN-containing dehydrogenase